VLEDNRAYVNLNPKCEPQLGRRGLYSLLGGRSDAKRGEMAILWVLNLSDGGNSLLDIAERSGMPFREIAAATRELLGVGLLEERKAA
jgi:aminopeptidase-like protein